MINLLPPNDKRQLSASRANTLLLRYNIFLLGALAFLCLSIGVTYVFLTNTQTAAEKTVSENQQEVAGYANIQQQEKAFKEHLQTAKQILDKEIIYTKTILAVSNLLPSGIVIQNLNLDAQTFGTQTNLAVQAKTLSAAVSLKNSLEESPLFSNVHFQSISSTPASGADAAYPVAVTLNVTIDKNAALSTTAPEGAGQP
ncbi:MAG: hypothetical protein JWO55_110 [Candidatus Saccharibacteria bacterium]|jgi:Tfp pilus assembly protein PilN|nr:hypothetical protein [Candidatus Saccharibacteria bacterium]